MAFDFGVMKPVESLCFVAWLELLLVAYFFVLLQIFAFMVLERAMLEMGSLVFWYFC